MQPSDAKLLDDLTQKLIDTHKQTEEEIIHAFEIPPRYFKPPTRDFMHRWRDDGVQLACLIERLEKANKNG